MSQAPESNGPPDAGVPDEAERTRKITRPPVPPTAEAVGQPPPVPDDRPDGGGSPSVVLADQPTDRLPQPAARQRTDTFGPWQPLQPRVVSRRRSRTPYVVTALVLLILVVGVVAVLVYGG
jgi:hypothetical protein